MSYYYEGGKRFRQDRDGDWVYDGDYDIDAENECKNQKLCPFMPETTVYHNDRKNYLVPEHGMNKMLNYDVHQTRFRPCIKERCIAFDPATGECKRIK